MELSKIYSGKSNHYDITVLDNAFTRQSKSVKRWGIKFQQIDITDKTQLNAALDDADIIYHLAGITNVGTTIKDKDASRDKKVKHVGIEGTRNIIKLSPEKAKIVFPSTHVVFEGLKVMKEDIAESLEPKPILEYSKRKYQSKKTFKTQAKIM